jgi:hypothetical protein
MHMQAVKLQTRVLPGHRIEVSSPDLRDGADVEVVVMMEAPASDRRQNRSMQAILRSLPAGRSPRAFATWEDYERFLRQEKESWER